MQSRPTRRRVSWVTRLTTPRVPIRSKLAIALLVPVLTLVAVSSYELARISRESGAVERQTRLAAAADGPSGLIEALQNERNWAVVELIGQGGQVTVPVEGYDATRADTDDARRGFRAQLERGADQTMQAYEPAIEQLEPLEPLRRRIDDYAGPRDIANAAVFADEVFEDYTRMIEPFFAGTSAIVDSVDDPDLRQGAGLIDVSARAAETVGQLANHAITYALLSNGGIDSAEEIRHLSGLLGQFGRYANEAKLRSTAKYESLAHEHFERFVRDVSDQITSAMATGQFDVNAFLDTVTVPNDESYNGLREQASEILGDVADDINHEAAERQRLYLLLVILTVVLAVGAVWLASLSITRPLRTLRAQATRMASHDLPDAVADVLDTPMGEDVAVPAMAPISVKTRDEVADVAASLNQVREAAIELAVGEAVLQRNVADSLVNMGRRNQSLLARQLDFITELEKQEPDPDILSNLFRLDHLATRMRRNAESLLVLAGVQTPRRWTSPVRIRDLIRAALSEVEDYNRAKVGYVEAVTIPGSVAADLAHLMAELTENALIFSPPDETVEINGLSQIAGYTISIVDHGLGMRPYEIAQANRRLAGTESFTVAPSKYLGHYVAGNLAVRHGIHVKLHEAPRRGITATIHVPARLAAADNRSGTNLARYGKFLQGERTGQESGSADNRADRSNGNGGTDGSGEASWAEGLTLPQSNSASRR